MSSAQVHAIERLAEFKAALQIFADKAKDAMSSNAMEIRRSHDWLETQLQYWQSAIRRAEEEVAVAKNELARRRMMRIGDRPLDTTEQEKTLRRAQQRLADAEQKRDHTKTWIRQLPDAVEDYDGQARPFQDLLDLHLAQMIRNLEQKLAALESYRQIHPSSGGSS